MRLDLPTPEVPMKATVSPGLISAASFFMPRPGERANGQHQRIARHLSGFGKLGLEVVAQINLVENDHRTRAAFATHDQHAFQSRGVERRVGGGDEKNGFDVRGEDLRGGVAAAGLAGDLRGARQHGLDGGLLLVGHELDGHPIADFGKLRMITARFVNEFAGDLRGEFRVRSPDAVEMFVLHRDSRRDETLGEIGRELFVAPGVPAEPGQAHKDWIGCIMRPGQGCPPRNPMSSPMLTRQAAAGIPARIFSQSPSRAGWSLQTATQSL